MRSEDAPPAGPTTRHDRPLLPYVLVLLGLSLPLWAVGWLAGGELLPGLPVGAVAFLCPVVAASIVVHRQEGADGVRALLTRSVDARRITDRRWYLAILGLMPAVFALSYGAVVVLDRPHSRPGLHLLTLPAAACSARRSSTPASTSPGRSSPTLGTTTTRP
ncbi:MAG TPA: hypothetical protein VFI47_05270 [Acidimicrobiales bacterium]|nr:hypothetical protein [Acidimicrobiales bacterium]